MDSRFERPSKTQKRVVVTGVGAVTPLGNTIEESWAAALRGQSGIAKITKFDTTGFDVTFAGEVKGFNPDLYIEKKEQKKMEEFIHYSIAASKMAVEMANLELTEAQVSCLLFAPRRTVGAEDVGDIQNGPPHGGTTRSSASLTD